MILLKKKINIFNLLKINVSNYYLYGSFGSQFINIPELEKKQNNYIVSNMYIKILFYKLIGLKNGWRVRLKLVGRGISFFKRIILFI